MVYPFSSTRRQLLNDSAGLLAVSSISRKQLLGNEGAGKIRSQTADGEVNWTQYQYDPQNTGAVPSATGPAEGVEEKWRLGIDGGDADEVDEVVVGPNRVYATGGQSVYAVEKGTRSGVWRTDLGMDIAGLTLINRSVLVTGSSLTLLDRESGDELWTESISGTIPTATGRHIYYGSGSSVVKFDIQERTEVWEHDVGGGVTPPAVGEQVYARGEDLVAIDPASGSENWRVTSLGGRPSGAVTLAGDNVIVSDGSIHAYDTETGTERWQANISSVQTGVAVDEDRVFVPDQDSLRAFSLNDGTEVWSHDMAGPIYRPPITVGDIVYVLDYPGRLSALRVDTGERVWRQSIDNGLGLAYADGVVYANSDTAVYAFTESPNQPPEPSFEVLTSNPTIGESVRFDARDSTDDNVITEYEWDFDGDGQFEGNGATIAHTFEETGSYDITLRTTDARGASRSTTTTITVSPPNQKPEAEIDISHSAPTTGDRITFNAAGSTDPDGSITSYEWDFDGDGKIEATGQSVTHRFRKEGEYIVSLSVTDDSGQQATAEQTISVAERQIEIEVELSSKELVSAVDSEPGQLTIDVTNYDPDNELIFWIGYSAPGLGLDEFGNSTPAPGKGEYQRRAVIPASDSMTFSPVVRAYDQGEHTLNLDFGYQFGESAPMKHAQATRTITVVSDNDGSPSQTNTETSANTDSNPATEASSPGMGIIHALAGIGSGLAIRSRLEEENE